MKLEKEADRNDLIYMIGELYVSQRLLKSENMKLQQRLEKQEDKQHREAR